MRELQLIRQVEGTECGLACMAMIALYYGRDIDLVELRRRLPMRHRGVSFAELRAVAAGLGLRARSLALEPVEISALKAPCILHWNSGHFVVMRQAGMRHIVIHDPLSGVREVALTELARHFAGFALELWPAVDSVGWVE